MCKWSWAQKEYCGQNCTELQGMSFLKALRATDCETLQEHG